MINKPAVMNLNICDKKKKIISGKTLYICHLKVKKNLLIIKMSQRLLDDKKNSYFS